MLLKLRHNSLEIKTRSRDTETGKSGKVILVLPYDVASLAPQITNGDPPTLDPFGLG